MKNNMSVGRYGYSVTTVRRSRNFVKAKVEAASTETGGNLYKWANCLYLSFLADDFPLFKRAKLVDFDWEASGVPNKRFEYEDSDANALDWHGGCTFYQEMVDVESGLTWIKIGCDYSHGGDDDYMRRDAGEELLETDGMAIVKQFVELMERRASDVKELVK